MIFRRCQEKEIVQLEGKRVKIPAAINTNNRKMFCTDFKRVFITVFLYQ